MNGRDTYINVCQRAQNERYRRRGDPSLRIAISVVVVFVLALTLIR